MYLIVGLCLVCSWVAPSACRSVDTREPPSEDLEPFVAHHHHEGNIAELLIPLLERSLAQSEARDNERAHRRSKGGKKVIQVLPYRGSEEHKRKGWRKLNSHKKQVVEITPLHGKNRAKPLAYILSAAKPHKDHAETNDDVSSSNTSELEHDKSTSEEQQSSEEKEVSEDTNVNVLRSGNDDNDSPSASSNVQSSEDTNSKESKDLSASDKESDDATIESDATAEKSEEKKLVVIEESEEDEPMKNLIHKLHNLRSAKTVSVEEDDETLEDVTHTVEDFAETVEDAAETGEDEKTVENDDTPVLDQDATIEADTTVETPEALYSRTATAEDIEATIEDVEPTVEEKDATVEDIEATVEDQAATAEDVEHTVEDKTATIEEEEAIIEDNVSAEDKAGTIENDATVEDELTVADATVERDGETEESDANIERDATVEDDYDDKIAPIEEPDQHLNHVHVHSHPHTAVSDVEDINRLIDTIGRQATVENEDSVENDGGYIENDIVISRGRQESNSAEKSISKLFNARARDIIELIQSSVEASTAPQRDCLENSEKHHDHKSYRLSFLFNK